MHARKVIVCADDFGADERVNAAVLRLVEAGRLSAVSCFTDAPSWRAAGPMLVANARRVYLGLHFNLTQPFGQGERPLAYWIVRALGRVVDGDAVRAHLRRQWHNFVAVVGRPPDYVDGHQHVHAFPLVRSILQDFVTTEGRNDPVPIRDISRPFGHTDAPCKRLVIRCLATIGPQLTLGGATSLNTGFAGDYSLCARRDYERLFVDWLARSPDRGLIMCHPALPPAHAVVTAQEREYEFLASAHYPKLLATHGFALARRPD